MGLRAFAERISRGVVLTRRLPREFGGAKLRVSPEGGGLRYWRYNVFKVDPGLFRAVERFVKPGAVVWDIGANMGLFAFAAASRCGQQGSVLAVEPDVDNASLLLRTRAGLPSTYGPVQVLPYAVVDAPSGFVEFEVASRSRSSNSIKGAGLTQKGGVRETRLVPVTNLDTLMSKLGSPSVVKIDVEGAEDLVLAGAERVLATARPVLVLEVEQESAIRVGGRLLDANYRMFDGDALTSSPKEILLPVWNTYAVPVEDVARILGRWGG